VETIDREKKESFTKLPAGLIEGYLDEAGTPDDADEEE